MGRGHAGFDFDFSANVHGNAIRTGIFNGWRGGRRGDTRCRYVKDADSLAS